MSAPRSVTHEIDENGRIACGVQAGEVVIGPPGASTCGHSNCQEIRARVHANNRPSFLTSWPTPWTEGQRYAAKAYSEMRHSTCPGGQGHEGNGASAEYCDACIATAIAKAFEAGQEWAGYSS